MIEKLKQSLDKGVAAVSIKSNEFVEITKLRTLNTSLEKEIELEKKQLAAVFYSQWLAGEQNQSNLEALCQAIKAREVAIRDNLSKINQLQRENEQILSAQPQRDMVLCSCGKANTVGVKFCVACGKKVELPKGAEIRSCICGMAVPMQAKFCPKCGNRMESGSTAAE